MSNLYTVRGDFAQAPAERVDIAPTIVVQISATKRTRRKTLAQTRQRGRSVHAVSHHGAPHPGNDTKEAVHDLECREWDRIT